MIRGFAVVLAAAVFPVLAQRPLERIQLPPGFRIELFAEVPAARSLALGAKGTLVVGNRSGRAVYAVAAGGRVRKIADDLTMPNGVAFRDGAPCNVCDRAGYGAIGSFDVSERVFTVHAGGVRNSVGFDWQPGTRELWFTDNGRDWLGDDLPADELNRAPRAGMHFGFPHCHQGDTPDPEYGRDRNCAEFEPPARKLGPHVAALGMRFYTGTMFPAEYRNQIFIAEHGSWNRSKKIGYRVSLVRIDAAGQVTAYETFVQGWLQGDKVWGRPVDLEMLPDGSLLVSDDHAGAVYRISYWKP